MLKYILFILYWRYYPYLYSEKVNKHKNPLHIFEQKKSLARLSQAFL